MKPASTLILLQSPYFQGHQQMYIDRYVTFTNIGISLPVNRFTQENVAVSQEEPQANVKVQSTLAIIRSILNKGGLNISLKLNQSEL